MIQSISCSGQSDAIADRIQTSALEHVFQRKLDQARSDRGGVDNPETAGTDQVSWIAKLRMVKGIEKFGTEVEAGVFR